MRDVWTFLRNAQQQILRSDWSGRSLVLAFLVLYVGAALPILSVKVPPLGDYANHLSRMFIITSGASDAFLTQYYKVKWAIIPNLAMDVLVPPLLHFVDVYVAGKIFVLLVVFVLVSGPMALNRVVTGRFSPVPLLAFGFIYNGFFMIGLMNYLFGVGLAVWATAIWIWGRERSAVFIALQSVLFTTVLFFCHLYAVGLYLLAVGSYELWAWSKRSFRFDGRLGGLTVLLGVLLALVMILLMNGPTWGLSGVYDWDDQGKIEGLAAIFRLYDDKFDLVVLLAFLAALGFGLSRGVLNLHPAGMACLIFSALAYLAMPATLFGSMLADQRMPIAILMFAIGFVRVDLRSDGLRLGFVAVLAAICFVRYAEVGNHWQQIERYVQEFNEGLATVERGARVMVAQADEPDGTVSINDGLSHVPCLAIIERSALVTTAFTVKGKQILGVKPPFTEIVDRDDGFLPNMSQLVAAESQTPANDPFWATWYKDHDYVVEMFGGAEAINPDPDHLELTYKSEKFQIFRILKDVDDEESSK